VRWGELQNALAPRSRQFFPLAQQDRTFTTRYNVTCDTMEDDNEKAVAEQHEQVLEGIFGR